MGAMMRWLGNLRARLGDFWWWSIVLFIALRCGDAINAFIGLWLVPKYVPQDDLGAVLPMMQLTTFLGLPIAIAATTFLKYVNKYRTLGENGKVKSLVRMFWSVTAVSVILITLAAYFIMPHFFERIRIVSGSLGMLIFATSVLSSISPMFTNAMQGLKKFNALTIANILTSPVRLLVMIIAMPVRALSGYMLGQCLPYLVQIIVSAFALKNELSSKIKAVSFWRTDLRSILKYAILVMIWLGVGGACSALHMMILRQRLSVEESAAYYVISRLAELATCVGMPLLMVMLPMAAEAQVSNKRATWILVRTILGTIISGGLITVIFWLFGSRILSMVSLWNTYIQYADMMAVLALVLTIRMVTVNFINFEVAQDRWAFLSYTIPLGILETICLYAMTVPEWFDPQLRNIIYLWLLFAVLELIANVVQFLLKARH